MPVARTRSALLKKRLDPFTRVLNAVEQGDVTALHRARVASRRLRELLPVLQLKGETARKVSKRLRKVTSRLGRVRELDVLLLLIDELRLSGRQATALARVGVSVAKSRDDARKRLLARLPVVGMRKLAQKLDRFVDDLRVTEADASREAARSWRWAIDAQVAGRASRLSAAIADAGAMYLPERLHKVRIAAKKLRYAYELARDLAGEKGGAELRVFKRTQDVLGRMHDLQMLTERVRTVQALLAPPNVTVWRDLDALSLTLDDECRRLHARYMRLRPSIESIAETLSARPQASAAPHGQSTRRVG